MEEYTEGVHPIFIGRVETPHHLRARKLAANSPILRNQLSVRFEGKEDESRGGYGVIIGDMFLWSFDHGGSHESLCQGGDAKKALAKINFTRKSEWNKGVVIDIVVTNESTVKAFVGFLVRSNIPRSTRFVVTISSSPPLRPVSNTWEVVFDDKLGKYPKGE